MFTSAREAYDFERKSSERGKAYKNLETFDLLWATPFRVLPYLEVSQVDGSAIEFWRPRTNNMYRARAATS